VENELNKQCFFCSKNIEGKKSMEHIIPNSLLGKLGIKEETVSGDRKTQYSRIKVPSHQACNNEFGSMYEEKVLGLLDDPDNLYELLIAEEALSPITYQPDESPTSIITTWLSKIFYGLFYDDLLKTNNDSWREICSTLIHGDNFKFVRSSYANGQGFQLPSSLYVFKTNNDTTDLITMAAPSSILFKIKNLTFILCICDGFLTKNYLSGSTLDRLRNWIKHEDLNNVNFPSHKLAFGEILALLNCIPKTPKFAYSENQITNMSAFTMTANPAKQYQIDSVRLREARSEIFNLLKINLSS
jgi:hypothetical protein